MPFTAAIWRTFFQPDARLRHAMRWYARMGRRVWFSELKNFLFRDRRTRVGPTLEEFWGAPQDAQERSMSVRSNVVPTSTPARRDLTIVESGIV